MNPPPEDRARMFIAVAPGTEALAAARDLQRGLAAAIPRHLVRWSSPRHFHITLRFLGDVPLPRIPDLYASLAAALAPHPPCRLALGGLGAFPSAARPRVLWLGITGNLDALDRLERSARAASAGFGSHDEPAEAFHPHLTLGRVTRPAPELTRALASRLEPAATPPSHPWEVREVLLFRSHLQPSGAIHEVEARFSLGPPGTPAATHRPLET